MHLEDLVEGPGTVSVCVSEEPTVPVVHIATVEDGPHLRILGAADSISAAQDLAAGKLGDGYYGEPVAWSSATNGRTGSLSTGPDTAVHVEITEWEVHGR